MGNKKRKGGIGMVEWKKLGEIMTIVRGASPRPITNYITNDADGVNWIKIGDVASDAKYITSSNEKITKEGAAKSRFLHSGDFILSNSMSFGRPYILKIDGCIHDGWIAMSDFEQHVSSGYLYEILNSNKVQDYWKMKANNGGAMTNLNSDIVRQTIIPIPSLSEQSRIVSILDTFTSSISNLKQQIEERRKQYEYERDLLLDLEGKEGVEMKKLGEVGVFIRGNGIQKADFVEEGYSCIHYGQIHARYGFSAKEAISKIEESLYKKCKKAKTGDVILATTSEDAEGVAKPFVWLGEEDVAVSGDAFIYHHNQIGKFMGYQFLTRKFMQFKVKYATGAKVVRISGDNMAKFEIPLPPLSTQSRIVSILDTFEQSISNLEEQLAMREKQYEYYRNQLLTFEGEEERGKT